MGESAFDERERGRDSDATLDAADGAAALAVLSSRHRARIVVDTHARERVDTLLDNYEKTRTDNDLAFATESTQKKRIELTPEMRAEMPTLLDETLAFDTEPTHKRRPVPEETLSIEVDVNITAAEEPAPADVAPSKSQRVPAAQPASLRAQTAPLATPLPPSHARPRAQPTFPISQAPPANDVVGESGVRPVVAERAIAEAVRAPRRSGRWLSVLCFFLGAVTAFAIVVALRYPEARALLAALRR